jgi:hypothetical protein
MKIQSSIRGIAWLKANGDVLAGMARDFTELLNRINP